MFTECLSSDLSPRRALKHLERNTGYSATLLFELPLPGPRVSDKRPGNKHKSLIQREEISALRPRPLRKGTGRGRSDAHDRAHLRRYVIDRTAVKKLPDQEYVGRVHQEEDRRIEGNRLGR